MPLAGDVVHEQPLDSTPRFLELDRSQVQVVRTAPGIAIGDEREPELMVLLEVLGGSSGAPFSRLERRSRANLRVGADAVIGLKGGALTVHYSTAERLEEA